MEPIIICVGPGFYINSHNYQLFAGACRDSVYNSLTISQVARSPPQPLIQIYYQCVLRPYDSFYQALGLSLGNSDVYTAFVFFGCMAVFMVYLWYCRGFSSELHIFISEPQRRREEKKDEDGGVTRMEYGKPAPEPFFAVSNRVVPFAVQS